MKTEDCMTYISFLLQAPSLKTTIVLQLEEMPSTIPALPLLSACTLARSHAPAAWLRERLHLRGFSTRHGAAGSTVGSKLVWSGCRWTGVKWRNTSTLA